MKLEAELAKILNGGSYNRWPPELPPVPRESLQGTKNEGFAFMGTLMFTSSKLHFNGDSR